MFPITKKEVLFKKCSKCKSTKGRGEFYIRSNKYLFSWCISCENSYKKNNFKKYEPKFNGSETRTCNKCEENKPLTKDFWSRYARDASGIHKQCKICLSKKQATLSSVYKIKNSKNEPARNWVKLKQCSYCKELLPTKWFDFNRQNNNGISYKCKTCRNIFTRFRIVIGINFTFDDIIQKVKQFNFLCAYCKTNTASTIDHFYPLNAKSTDKGNNDLQNLFPCCTDCNSNKSNKDPLEWLYTKNYMWVPLTYPQACLYC